MGKRERPRLLPISVLTCSVRQTYRSSVAQDGIRDRSLKPLRDGLFVEHVGKSSSRGLRTSQTVRSITTGFVHHKINMRYCYAVLIMLILTFAAGAQMLPIESGWLGIKLFVDRRATVERKLGHFKIVKDGYLPFYKMRDANIMVSYSTGNCRDLNSGRFKISADTVFQYVVNILPGHEIALNDLKWQAALYARSADPEVRGFFYYGNKDAGITVTTFLDDDRSEKVETIAFNVSSSDAKRFACDTKKKTGSVLRRRSRGISEGEK